MAYLSFLSPVLCCVIFTRLLDLSEPPPPRGLGRICGCPSSSKMLGTFQLPSLCQPLLSSFPPPPPPLCPHSFCVYCSPHTSCTQLHTADWMMMSWGWGSRTESRRPPPFLRASGYIPGHSALPIQEPSRTGRSQLTSGRQAKYLWSS